MSEQKTINVKEFWNLQTKPNTGDGSFVVTVTNEKLKVNLHFKRSWLIYLARDLWEVIESEEKQIAHIRKQMERSHE